MAAALRVRVRRLSLVDILAGLCVIAALASPWSISIPPAHLAESFGFETPICWLSVAALIAAVLLQGRAAITALAAAELAVIGWFGWAMLVVTTPRFTSVPFPFVGTDLIGPGWYAAAVGLLIAAGGLVKDLLDRDVPIGLELWVLTVLPGYGLVRLDQWFRGLMWTVLFSAALYFGSTDSPDPAQFADYGSSGNLPPPIPRGIRPPGPRRPPLDPEHCRHRPAAAQAVPGLRVIPRCRPCQTPRIELEFKSAGGLVDCGGRQWAFC